jgi:drug/metabolite transporter (DMT)-like permease
MSNSSSILTFIIVSFCLALVLIMKKDSLPSSMKRYLALLALVMVGCSFVLIVYSLLHMSTLMNTK